MRQSVEGHEIRSFEIQGRDRFGSRLSRECDFDLHRRGDVRDGPVRGRQARRGRGTARNLKAHHRVLGNLTGDVDIECSTGGPILVSRADLDARWYLRGSRGDMVGGCFHDSQQRRAHQ